MESKVANLSIVSNKSLEAAKAANLQHYDISSALQTSLDFKEIIAIFCEKIQPMIAHSGFIYTNPLFDLEYKKGIEARHACLYSLTIEDQALGELKLTRQQRFNENELQLLETLLCCLVYPLKNATLYQQAINMAHTDPLTKIQNRTAFNDSILREYNLAKRNRQHLSLIFIDIDYFKSINDQYGHECGDFALSSVAKWIKASIRDCDMIFRYGGEEFVVLLSDTPLDKATLIAERIRQTIEKNTLAYAMQTLQLTASLGVSTLLGNDTVQNLINRADNAMYQAKQQGRNRVQISE